MPIDPVKLQQVIDGAAQLEKRFDSLIARRMADAAAKAQMKADRARREAEVSETPKQVRDYPEPAAEKQKPDWLDIAPYEAPAWFDSSEREELRTGALSKERI
jgi:hypothetical protein